jgi:hypothetical protein
MQVEIINGKETFLGFVGLQDKSFDYIKNTYLY